MIKQLRVAKKRALPSLYHPQLINNHLCPPAAQIRLNSWPCVQYTCFYCIVFIVLVCLLQRQWLSKQTWNSYKNSINSLFRNVRTAKIQTTDGLSTAPTNPTINLSRLCCWTQQKTRALYMMIGIFLNDQHRLQINIPTLVSTVFGGSLLRKSSPITLGLRCCQNVDINR